MSKVKVYEGTFLKKDGSSRTMKFVRKNDLPESFLKEVTKGGQAASLPSGMERVWDVENSGFRVFNHNTIKGELTSEYREDVFSATR